MKHFLYFQIQRFANWRAVVFFSVFLLVLAACRKDDKLIGLEVQPDGELLPLETVDSFSARAFTIPAIGLRSDETYTILGQTRSDAMGISRSAINVNFQIPGTGEVNFPGALDYQVDSIVLHLQPFEVLTERQPISLPVNIYRLNRRLEVDDDYFSDDKVQLGPTPIGHSTVTFDTANIPDSVKVEVEIDSIAGVPYRHRIYLDPIVGEQLLFGLGTEYNNAEEFKDYFPGIQIAIDSSMSSEDLGMLRYNLTNGESGIYLYISSGTTRLIQFYPITGSSARYNSFNHNLEGSAVQQALNDPTNDDDEIYVQGLAGVRSQIEFPYLNAYARKVDAAVSKATVILTVSDNQPSGRDPAPQLFLLGTVIDDETGDTVQTVFTPDFNFSTARYGGSYDEESGTYEFDVTRQIQAIIEAAQDDRDVNLGFHLVREVFGITASSNIPSETVLLGSDDIVLKLHMTNLNP